MSGHELVLTDGTKKVTYKTVTLAIPATAHVRDNGAKASLGEVKSGQRAIVIRAPHRTWVIAHTIR